MRRSSCSGGPAYRGACAYGSFIVSVVSCVGPYGTLYWAAAGDKL